VDPARDGGAEVVWCDDPNADPCLRRNVVTTGGHADPAFTARTYVHRDDDRARALANLAGGLRGAGR